MLSAVPPDEESAAVEHSECGGCRRVMSQTPGITAAGHTDKLKVSTLHGFVRRFKLIAET
ncbi:hypothetical protein EYF80_000306 [Liparis tanakae]|uniref:Uncharacterized protein n=1 Tax=Liparis tanakae TaxID=230148 RepID=A0A4Z2JIQ1_9TELE|nr:hypothetical protein EYF80_000306 [Liparis tanakae]